MASVSIPKEAHEDLLSHRSAWLEALEQCRDRATNDTVHSYWVHEVNAFNRTFDQLTKD